MGIRCRKEVKPEVGETSGSKNGNHNANQSGFKVK